MEFDPCTKFKFVENKAKQFLERCWEISTFLLQKPKTLYMAINSFITPTQDSWICSLYVMKNVPNTILRPVLILSELSLLQKVNFKRYFETTM
jgi:hypothetical protein